MKPAIYTLKIDPEFQGLIEPLEGDEWDRLEKSLRAEGFREDRGKIITWNEIIVDGHHRYQICHQNNIPFTYIEQDFADRDAVKLWIINEQLGRRNLNSYQRSALVLKEKEVVTAEARERMLAGKKLDPPVNSPEGASKNKSTGEARQKLADKAGVSGQTITRVARLEEEADEETKQKLRSGETSVNKAYSELKQKAEGQPTTNGSSSEDPFKSPRVKELIEEKLVVEHIIKVKPVEYVVRWRDGTVGTISRKALLKEDFCKCRSCNGYGVLPKSSTQKERKEK